MTTRSKLTRKLQPMPASVRAALTRRKLMAKYRQRPAYQQNDYLGWIAQAKQPETRKKRLNQMLDELQKGGLYMRMTWRARKT